ncbi:MAG: PHB depolymerase family esterase [Gemmatimonadota bacterium]
MAHLGVAGVGPIHGQASIDPMNTTQLRTFEASAGSIDYRLHVPREWAAPRSLLVLLHGCLQGADDIAAGTRMNQWAEEGGFAVLYPQQDPARNPQRCWNWFDTDQQRADGPEVSRIVALLDAVAAELEVPRGGVDLAGMSAGAAMATILAVTHPDRFHRVALHSGITWGAASNVAEGVAAMSTGGPERIDLDDPRLAAFAEASRPERVLVLQGREDPAVAAVNGVRAAARWVELFGLRGVPLTEGPEAEETQAGRQVVTRGWSDAAGDAVVTLVEVVGLGHAWSGGDPAGSYTDPEGPSASRMMVEFFQRSP